MPNTKQTKEERQSLESRNFFLTIPHFNEIENVFELLSEYRNGILKPQDLKFFKDKVKKIKYIKSWKNGMAEYAEYSTDPSSKFGFHSLKDFAVVLETHTQDEAKGQHLHIYIEFEKAREISSKHFDFLGKHGNLQKVKNIFACLQYMRKENEIKASFDVISKMIEVSKGISEIKKLIFDLVSMHSWTYEDVLESFRNKIALVNIKQTMEVANDYHAKLARDSELDWMKSNRIRKITPELIQKRLTPYELGLIEHFPVYQELIDVVNRLLVKGNNHEHKQCTIALVGEPNIGKSSFADALAKHFVTYYFPIDNWHTKYQNHIYEMWIWHEWDFRIISKSDFLLLTEGAKCDLRVKFAKAKKFDRPLLILTSNLRFEEECKYKFKRDLSLRESCIRALKVRIQEFDFKDKKLHFLTKLLISVNEDI